MEVTITLDHGPLNAEFTGEEREELEDNLLSFIEFLEENEDIFGGSGFSIEQEDEEGNPGLDPDYWEDRQDTPDESTDDGGTGSGVTFGSIPNRTDIDEETLNRYFGIDPEEEEPPYLSFDVGVLGESGSSRSEKQMRGSLILLTLWRECHGVEEVQSPQLKDALRISGIDDDTLYNMYGFNDDEGDRYFSRDGSGVNTDISLTMPGEREGYDQIQRTIERLEGGWEADE
jgi:hypothetical protein